MTECTSVPRCPCHLRHCLFQIEVQCFFLRRSRGLSGNTDRSWGSILATGPMPFSPLQRSNHPAWWKITLMMKNHPACWKIILKMENHPHDGKSPWWWEIVLMKLDLLFDRFVLAGLWEGAVKQCSHHEGSRLSPSLTLAGHWSPKFLIQSMKFNLILNTKSSFKLAHVSSHKS